MNWYKCFGGFGFFQVPEAFPRFVLWSNLAEQYRKWYSFDMSYYDDIYEIAVDNHGLVSTQAARDAGVPAIELPKLAQRGKLENIARGLYRLTRYVPTKNDDYATAVARLGEGAYLFGESVIAMLGLAPTNPKYIYVAAPKRTRRKLPASIRIRKPGEQDKLTLYDGIPSQDMATAIRAASSTMMDDRLMDAAAEASRQGYLLDKDYDELKRDMGWQ